MPIFSSTSVLDIGNPNAHRKLTVGLATTGHEIGYHWGGTQNRARATTPSSSTRAEPRRPGGRRGSLASTTAASWSADWASETGSLRKLLRSQSSILGSDRPEWSSSYGSGHRKFSAQEVREARGLMDPKLREDLKAVHYSLGEDRQSRLPFSLWETDSMRQAQSHWCPAEAAARPRRPDGGL
mmetsp:Transcript_34636/g.106341  ORF Transcript_34636/g.106341 Transcript_34636/m.106341 type:complete len:183 (+) Transcript_34636:100-648(+)